MTRQERANTAVECLKRRYPEAECTLTYREPYQLLIATRLAAQCTDARVNVVAKELFSRYPTMEAIAEADIGDVEQIVRPCGVYRMKAKNIVDLCQTLLREYGGIVPDTVEELLKLPGVGRKTANLIVGDIYKKPAVVTDTHCIRIAGRLGLTDGQTNPVKVERALREILPPEESNDFCHRLVMFGREVCTARSPKCPQCEMRDICPSAK